MTARPNFARIQESQSRVDEAIALRGRAAPSTVELINAASVKAQAIRWLWPHWLAAGKLHILAGAPGCGKTTIMLSLVSTITTGGRWPDGSRASSGNVLLWSGEDDPADTLVPRLMAMGADLRRVYFVSSVRDGIERRPFDPSSDIPKLSAEVAKTPDIRLLAVDPLVSAVAGDSHRNAEVRRALQPLVDLGAAHGCALLGITHLSKGTTGRDPAERVTGSIAFGAAARMVLLAAKATNNAGEERRIMVRAKTNIAPDDGGFDYRIEQQEVEPEIHASVVTWGEAIDGTARELLAEVEVDPADEESSALDDAVSFLKSELQAGSKPASVIFKEARSAGHSERTVKRAKALLRIESTKAREGWMWSLGQEGAKPADTNQLGPLGPVGQVAQEPRAGADSVNEERL